MSVGVTGVETGRLAASVKFARTAFGGLCCGRALRHIRLVKFSRLKADLEARLRVAPESSGLERVRALLSAAVSAEAPFLRSHFVPGHITASAFVLSPTGQELLLISHKKLGMWLQPGGHLEEHDESHVEAARRELIEETGVRAPEVLDPWLDVDVHQIPAYGSLPAHLHFDLRVLFQVSSYDLARTDEVLGAEWFPLESLKNPGVQLSAGRGTDMSVARVAQRLLAARLAGEQPPRGEPGHLGREVFVRLEGKQ
jgi:8-oxo-dGTP pyrophosphatase MutT (NUDIX family)